MRTRSKKFTRCIILFEDKDDIFNLAKNAGTSVEQIERFYARDLPLSREMAKNLQSLIHALLQTVVVVLSARFVAETHIFLL